MHDLLLEGLQVIVVLEGRDSTLHLQDSAESIRDLAQQLLVVCRGVLFVVLLYGETEFAGPDRRSAVHEGVGRLDLDQELVDAVEHGFHVHDLQVPFEVSVLLHLLAFLHLSFVDFLNGLVVADLEANFGGAGTLSLVHLLILSLQLLPVALEALLGNYQFVLLDFEVNIPNDPQYLITSRVNLLVYSFQHLPVSRHMRCQFLQKSTDFFIRNFLELIHFLNVGLDILVQIFIQINLCREFIN